MIAMAGAAVANASRWVTAPFVRLSQRARGPVSRGLAGPVQALARRLSGTRMAPVGRVLARRPARTGAGALLLTLVLAVALLAAFVVPSSPGARAASRHLVASSSSTGIARREMAQILAEEAGRGTAARLPRATTPPAPAPASVADGPPLRAHEVFGFAPYWTLGQSTGFDVSGLTTIAYFAIPVHRNGTLEESGTGWDGYESQAFADLVARAHAAGDRVVLTVNCFTQPTLDALTSSPAAARTLANAVVSAITAKNLDGVNMDFEGLGSADQAGLTSLVATVAKAVRAVNPHDQVTLDTYASSAGDPNGFYDIPALAQVVDAFFVMAYDLNLGAGPTTSSPLTSSEFSDAEAAAQYASTVPRTKVVFGTSYFGYDWPTTDGTMTAQAMGTPVPVSFGQVMASGHPIYWDSVTDTAWTSYEMGSQWHEAYFETPVSIYLVTQLAQRYGFAGVGTWALGMDGNDIQMMTALDGQRPSVGIGGAGPSSTSPSASKSSAAAPNAPAGPATTTTGGPGSSTTTSSPNGSTTTTGPSSTTTTGPPGGGTTTTTAPPGGTTYRYSGIWQGQSVSLTDVKLTTQPAGIGTLVGTLTGFTTNDPSLSCLASAPALQVWSYVGSTSYWVEARNPADCATADFTFPVSAGPSLNPTTSGSGGLLP